MPTSAQGDNSIQTWGQEAGDGEKEEAARVLQGFLDARSMLDYPGLCAGISPKLLADLREQVADVSASCPRLLSLSIDPNADKAVLRAEARGIKVLSFRVDAEEQAFVVYSDR